MLYLYKSTSNLCKEYCCCVWAGTFNCFLGILDKLQKWIYRVFGCKLAASYESLAYGRNVTTLFFVGFTIGVKLVKLVFLPFSRRKSTRYSNKLVFLPPVVDIVSMSVSLIFLAQLDPGIIFSAVTSTLGFRGD